MLNTIHLSKTFSSLVLSVSILGSFSSPANAQTTNVQSSAINVQSSTSVNSSAQGSLCITNCEASSTPSNPNLPQLPDSNNSNNPKIKLITVTCDQQTCGTNMDWKKARISNNGRPADYTCTKNGSFAGQTVLGIDDYSDGFSLNTIKKINSPAFVTSSFKDDILYFKRGVTESQTVRRDCLTQNISAGNVDAWSGSTRIGSPKNNDDVTAFYNRPTGADRIGTFVAKDIPVYAYQYRYNIKFSESEKAAKSNLYRSMTGLDGVYDGVSMTYTYYTYKQNGQPKPWDNPNKSNANNGWLVYGNVNNNLLPPERCSTPNQLGCIPEIIRPSSSSSSSSRSASFSSRSSSSSSSSSRSASFSSRSSSRNSSSQVSTRSSSQSSLSQDDCLDANGIRLSGCQGGLCDTGADSNSSKCQGYRSPTSTSNSIVIGKSIIDSNKDRLATLKYSPNTKNLGWDVDLNSTSGCDKVEKSYVKLEGTKLVIYVTKAAIPAGAACTAVVNQYTHTNSEVSTIDATAIINAIKTKNFVVRIK